MKSLSDEKLMALYQEGHIDAFNELFKRYKLRTYAFLMKKVDRETANDLFQSIFMKLHQNREKFDGKRKFTSWFFVLACNVVNDYWRTCYLEKKNKMVTLDVQDKIDWDDLTLNLSDEERRILSLRYQQDKEFEEISNELNISQASSRKKVSRAVEKLRKYFKGSNEHES